MERGVAVEKRAITGEGRSDEDRMGGDAGYSGG